jgi:hypothetical protein
LFNILTKVLLSPYFDACYCPVFGAHYTTPDLAAIFDKQYYKEMGFKNEKYLMEKRSGKYIFW